ncbi:MAG TPA: acetylornithine transaminase [Candidatus Dormibacteraeota bacterium]|nr:acetylornithine transaminase [Candidatus Dormibacteraeota bacterium]
MSGGVVSLDSLRDRADAALMHTYTRQPLAIASGHGVWVTDDTGRELIDMVGGIAVNVLGHAHPAVTAALAEQSRALIHTSNLYYTAPQVELAERLIDTAFPGRVFLCNSGAEANECAIKLARKWGRRHRKGATGIVALKGGFHGRTMGALAATAQPRYREPFEPLPTGFAHVAADIESIAAAVDEDVAAVLLEPIQGESGVVPLSDSLIAGVRALCDERGVLLLLDEVQTGMGRTGRWWAHQHAGITPDVMTAAKGLGGGMPIGAVLAAPGADVLAPGDHGSTFGGGPLAATVACAVLRTIDEDGLVEHAGRIGEYLRESLLSLRADGVPVATVRGRGLMVGLVLDEPIAVRAGRAALDCGVIVNAVGDRVLRLLPALIITEAEVDEAMNRLRQAFMIAQTEAGA